MELTIEDLKKVFMKNENKEEALKMKKYMRNQFEFLGIRKPNRSELEKEYINYWAKLPNEEILKLIERLHNEEYREYMYTAQKLSLKVSKKLKYQDICFLTELTTKKSWWDNTDGYNSTIKMWLKNNPEYIEEYVNKYSKIDNLWQRREAIICQLSLKNMTNKKALKSVIAENATDSEFFIQKAIGWALRDYSKSNSEDVKEILAENVNELSKLAIREGSKYLEN